MPGNFLHTTTSKAVYNNIKPNQTSTHKIPLPRDTPSFIPYILPLSQLPIYFSAYGQTSIWKQHSFMNCIISQKHNLLAIIATLYSHFLHFHNKHTPSMLKSSFPPQALHTHPFIPWRYSRISAQCLFCSFMSSLLYQIIFIYPICYFFTKKFKHPLTV